MSEVYKFSLGTLYYSQKWSSSSKNYRIKLREHINAHFPNLGFLDLSNKNPASFISISHCKALGGYFESSQRGKNTGFDLEEKIRISLSTVERVSFKSEMEIFDKLNLEDGFRFIWPIKEAGFKAFSQKISVIPEINVLDARVDTSSNLITGNLSAKDRKGIFCAGSLNSDILFASVLPDE